MKTHSRPTIFKNIYKHPRNPTADDIMNDSFKNVKYNTFNDAIIQHSTANLDDVLNSPYFKKKYLFDSILSNNKSKIILKIKSTKGKDLVAKIYFADTGYENIKEFYDLLSNTNNDNVIKIIDLVIDNNFWYKICEYFSESDLKEYVDNNINNNIDIPNIFNQIVRGLKYLHDYNIVHCDVKLENVLILDNKIKIIDFELSKKTDNYYICNHQFGTTYYMSPESRDLCIHSKKTDIWELGVLLYYMITKKFPIGINNEGFDDHLYRKNCYKYPDMDYLLTVVVEKGLPVYLYTIVSQMLKFRDTERPTIDDIINFMNKNRKN